MLPDSGMFASCLQLVHAYAAAVDERDMRRLASCFEPDAEYFVDAVPTSHGAAESDVPEGGLPAVLRGRGQIVAFIEPVISAFVSSVHSIASLDVQPSGDEIKAVTITEASLVVPGPEDDVRLVRRAVRYLDVIGVDGRAASLRRREHQQLWTWSQDGGLSVHAPPDGRATSSSA